jgi:hypothetical protein
VDVRFYTVHNHNNIHKYCEYLRTLLKALELLYVFSICLCISTWLATGHCLHVGTLVPSTNKTEAVAMNLSDVSCLIQTVTKCIVEIQRQILNTYSNSRAFNRVLKYSQYLWILVW